jgi:hypothetical protein
MIATNLGGGTTTILGSTPDASSTITGCVEAFANRNIEFPFSRISPLA